MGRAKPIGRRLLQCILATTLACGAIVPAMGLTAQAEESPVVEQQGVENVENTTADNGAAGTDTSNTPVSEGGQETPVDDPALGDTTAAVQAATPENANGGVVTAK